MSWLSKVVSFITTPVRLVFNWMTRSIPVLKRLPSVSLPMRAALATFFFILVIIMVAASFAVIAPEQFVDKYWWHWLVATILLFVIPVVVYHLFRLLMMKGESPYPQIDSIWASALEQFDQTGIEITRVPLFVVLGSTDLHEARDVMRASHLEFNVSAPPRGNADIAVFGSPTEIFLFLPGCSCMSRLSTEPELKSHAASTGRQKKSAAGADVSATINPDQFDDLAVEEEVDKTLATDEQFPAGTDDVDITIPLPDDEPSDAAHATFGESAISGRQLSSDEKTECQSKLRHVCNLLTSARGAICPINGMITLLPFELIERSSGALQTAARIDLAVLREKLMIRCQNIVLVTQLQKVEGFRELVERVGEQQAQKRFGKGGTLWSIPKAERLKALGVHAVGAFEDWIYSLFRQETSLDHQHNAKLFMLLARTRRSQFKNNLSEVLAGGFSSDHQENRQLVAEQFLFGGCYFAATGPGKDSQAFVKGVFRKAIEQHAELEWAPHALQRDRQYQLAANFFALLGLFSIVAIGLMIFFRMRNGG